MPNLAISFIHIISHVVDAVRGGSVGERAVGDVDLHEEVCDEEGDPAGDGVGGNDEGDPRDGHKHPRREKVAEYVVVDLRRQYVSLIRRVLISVWGDSSGQ